MYVLRYVAGTPLKDRPHSETLGRWPSWVDAEEARERSPRRDQLEVVTRVVND